MAQHHAFGVHRCGRRWLRVRVCCNWRSLSAAKTAPECCPARVGADMLELSHELCNGDGTKCVIVWAYKSVDMFGDSVDGEVVYAEILLFASLVVVTVVGWVRELTGNAEELPGGVVSVMTRVSPICVRMRGG